MKNKMIILLCLSAFVLLLSFSGNALAGKPALKLGVNLDTTGYAAWLGEPELRAIQLYAEQVKRPVERGELVQLLTIGAE